MPTLSAVLRMAQQQLAGIDQCSPAEAEERTAGARIDVEVLLAHCLQKSRSYLFAYPEACIDENRYLQFLALLERRRLGEPIAYLIARQEFWSLDFYVDNSVLIPRPETELLVETALGILRGMTRATIVDAGTGSGAIAVALIKALKSRAANWRVLAIDSSAAALKVARDNIQTHGVGAHVHLLHSSWLSALGAASVDFVLANPPYIDVEDEHLARGDVRFEPPAALIAGEAGFADIRTLIEQALRVLKDGGWIILEHGWQQAASVRELLQHYGFADCKSLQDLAAHDRVTLARYIDTPGVRSAP